MGLKSTTKGAPVQKEAAFRCALFDLYGRFSLSGKFREKASILHKIAKKKCQVEDSEKANGVASRSGKKLWGEISGKPRPFWLVFLQIIVNISSLTQIRSERQQLQKSGEIAKPFRASPCQI